MSVRLPVVLPVWSPVSCRFCFLLRQLLNQITVVPISPFTFSTIINTFNFKVHRLSIRLLLGLTAAIGTLIEGWSLISVQRGGEEPRRALVYEPKKIQQSVKAKRESLDLCLQITGRWWWLTLIWRSEQLAAERRSEAFLNLQKPRVWHVFVSHESVHDGLCWALL